MTKSHPIQVVARSDGVGTAAILRRLRLPMSIGSRRAIWATDE